MNILKMKPRRSNTRHISERGLVSQKAIVAQTTVPHGFFSEAPNGHKSSCGGFLNAKWDKTHVGVLIFYCNECGQELGRGILYDGAGHPVNRVASAATAR